MLAHHQDGSLFRLLFRIHPALTSSSITSVSSVQDPKLSSHISPLQVRVTQLVVDAEAQGAAPPTDIPLHDLSKYQPTVEDLPLVHKLHHLAYALEVAFCRHEGHWPMTLSKNPPDGLPEEPEDRMAEWRERLHKAIYRTLIAGAALAGVYSEHLSRAEEEGIDTEWPTEQCGEFKNEEQLTFLERFAAYNIASELEEEEELYGPLAGWMLQNVLADTAGRTAMAMRFESGTGRAEICQNRKDCPVKLASDDGVDEGDSNRSSDSDAHFVVWQVIQMAWVLQHIEMTVRRRSDHDHESQLPLKSNESSPYRVPVVFLGIFQPEIVTIPSRIYQAQDLLIRADPTETAAQLGDAVDQKVYYTPNNYPQELTVRLLLDTVYWHTRKPNHITGDAEDRPDAEVAPVPPLIFKFFEYFLRRYLGVRFAFDAWLDAPEADNWELFASNFGLFAHDDVEGRESFTATGSWQDADFTDGSEILVSERPVPVKVYERFT